ncbi:CBS domain-containing protein [Idiomarina zobellii]|uniref:CBS domain-containing protein n=1 Tax=Idiomarina zobellii TaxID=86103 RepID=A0A837NDD2_9GAMM|nr:hypothetical protein [Idiomarina zobellii]KPD23210.1 hypothetical protein AFK76_10185 [Idiomarina zobellii]SDG09510.1 hypothetical protein SAMN04515658_11244 [Idiomarina zobellii]
MSNFKEIQWSSKEDSALIHHRFEGLKKLSWHDSALHVMDNFDMSVPVELSENTFISDAELALKQRSSRYACIQNNDKRMTGLLALRDLHGRKATQLVTSTQTHWGELTSKDLMTPLSSLPQVQLSDVQKSKIGDAAATLKSSGKDFLVVVNNNEVYGVISSLKIAELTGESINVFHLPSTFAEIISVVNHKEMID